MTTTKAIEQVAVAIRDELKALGVSIKPTTATKAAQAAITAHESVLVEENERLREALTPSAETKAAYIGEFSFTLPETDENGDEYQRRFLVPWTTIKEIMAAIRARAALEQGK